MAKKMSKFRAWLRKQPKGTRARLMREVSEAAVVRAQRGLPLSYACGCALSGLTGGKISLEDLCAKRGAK